jgi:hypothetical protein
LISHARKNIRHQLVELEEKRVAWQTLAISSELNVNISFGTCEQQDLAANTMGSTVAQTQACLEQRLVL